MTKLNCCEVSTDSLTLYRSNGETAVSIGTRTVCGSGAIVLDVKSQITLVTAILAHMKIHSSVKEFADACSAMLPVVEADGDTGPEPYANWCKSTVPTTVTAPSFSNLTPQSALIYKHMSRAGSVSAREAYDDHGITSATLASRICDIEREGFNVIRKALINPITSRRYTRYSLVA